MGLTKQEINRKLLHLFALSIPAGIFYLPKVSAIPWIVPSSALAAILAVSIVIEYLRFRVPAVQKLFFNWFGSMLRKEEEKRTTGSTYIIGAGLLCSVFFRNEPHIAFIVLTLFILGDATAALVGIGIGRIKIGKKSLEGSLACFALCLALFFFVFPYTPLLLEPWNGTIPLGIVMSVSLVITLLELIPLKIYKNIQLNDNLAVPVLAGYLMHVLYIMFY